MMKELNIAQVEHVNGGWVINPWTVAAAILLAEDIGNFIEGVADGLTDAPRVNN